MWSSHLCRSLQSKLSLSATSCPLRTTTNITSIHAGSFSPTVDVVNGAVGAVRYRSNRSRRGLYDGKDIRTGNRVSFSMKSTKRTFKPNVFKKRVYSEILDDMIQFHMTSSTLRSIDKVGGLDNYLLKNEFKEGEGWEIKKKILKRLKNQARIDRKAVERGEQPASSVSTATVVAPSASS